MSPEAPREECPACGDVPLVRQQEHGAARLRCPACQGVFVGTTELAGYVEAVTQDPLAARAFLRLLQEAIAQDAPDGSHLRRCPRCPADLERMGIGEHPFAIIDRCAEHGLWLDDGDLDRVVRQARAAARMDADAWNEGDPQRSKTRGYTSSFARRLACPNCGRRFPEADADQRCDDCGVALFRE